MKTMKLSTKLMIGLVVILFGLLLTQAIVSSRDIEKKKEKQEYQEFPVIKGLTKKESK